MLKRDEIESLRTEVAFMQIITKNPQLIKILHRVKCVASQDINILLVGETGTGKDLCAQAIHYLSSRRDKPFIILNCGMGPLELFDSVLFGHIKGAFTNAITDRLGLVEEADKGILFLDEINSMPRAIQVKLNRFLVTGEFRRLGENRLRKVDVRVIAATNQPLNLEIEKGRFREDLYYRIAEYMIELPPLRERQGDIRLLMDYFLEKFVKCYGKSNLKFSEDAYLAAEKHDWPGNIRELENIVKRCVIDDASASIITAKQFLLPASHSIIPMKSDFFLLPLHEAKSKLINEFEALYLEFLLQKYNGNVEECARQCGKHRSALWALIKKHNLKPLIYRC